MKSTSFIECIEPNAHADQFNLTWGFLHVEGGAYIEGKNMRFNADDIQLDDGGYIRANDGGYLQNEGRGGGVGHRLGATGASHGGNGGRGACNGYLVCRMNRAEPYGNLYFPREYGSGGGGTNGGPGMG